MSMTEARDFLPVEGVEWKEPWGPVDDAQARHAETELTREICATHVLAGCNVVALARRCDNDDWLFGIIHPQGRFAVVHLTYQRETLPQWPVTQLFADWDELERLCLLPDAVDDTV